jgi:hypothetical protein
LDDAVPPRVAHGLPQVGASQNAERLVNALASTGPHGGIWVNHVLLGPQRLVAFIARDGARLPELPPS